MNWFSTRHVVLAAAMLAGAGVAVAVKPGDRLSQHRPPVHLETAIPQAFGDWRIDTSIAPVTVSPDVQAQLDKIYNQTVTRTYINSRGERIMLAVAYGGDQSRSTQVHKPEVCYPMQGFQISPLTNGTLETSAGPIPIMNLVATQGQRVEPITYWIAVGDTVVRGALEQNLARLKYGLTGTVPDGMLVRVSNISRDPKKAYALQQQFVSDMLAAMPKDDAARLIGKYAASANTMASP